MESILRQFNPWWSGNYASPGITRDSYLERMLKLLSQEKIVILFGLRRVGKTVLMRQCIAKMLENRKPESILFASIDNPQLEKTPLHELLSEFRSLHGLRTTDDVVLFLDEVQVRPGFEVELKGIYDLEDHVRIVASGSSSLVVKHRGAHLTGRYRSIHIKPLDFGEYLRFMGVKLEGFEPDLLVNQADNYLHTGGMPEYVLNGDPSYISEMVTNMIFRDICGAYGLRDPKLLRELFFLLMGRVGKKISYSKLSRLLDVTDDTVKRYIGYFEDAFLVHLIEQVGTPNERKYGPKKVYSPDNGICAVISGLSETGPLAENLVYLKLMDGGEVRYHDRDGKEVDFVRGREAYEVKYRAKIDDEDMEVLEKMRGVDRRVMITRSMSTPSGKVSKVPLWKFLLEAR
jgi:hypothetical protein